ncbi:Uncharacterized protein dnm_095600 [Desulfonema magnum]|uniref:Uncharacterized protein n=1 Tax=Desulfonema magnum TaxID=45655 RepID=A0A975BYU5_9BACT|nr:Uncharacterized protein dnm_095600 [Desulfonema magnum]
MIQCQYASLIFYRRIIQNNWNRSFYAVRLRHLLTCNDFI